MIDVKFSGLSWKANEGVYYSSYDKPKGSELSAKTDQHKLYFHKLASRRANLLSTFNILDPHPIAFDSHLMILEEGILIVNDGKLIVDYNRIENPESFISTKGRYRNYGN